MRWLLALCALGLATGCAADGVAAEPSADGTHEEAIANGGMAAVVESAHDGVYVDPETQRHLEVLGQRSSSDGAGGGAQTSTSPTVTSIPSSSMSPGSPGASTSATGVSSLIGPW